MGFTTLLIPSSRATILYNRDPAPVDSQKNNFTYGLSYYLRHGSSLAFFDKGNIAAHSALQTLENSTLTFTRLSLASHVQNVLPRNGFCIEDAIKTKSGKTMMNGTY